MEFIKARWFTETGTAGRHVDLMVMHLAIVGESSSAAEGVARYFATTDRKASAHYTVDNDSTVQSVRDLDVAYAAPGANHDGIQVEQAGTLQSPKQWGDRYSADMLARAAQLVARKCDKFDIPPKWRTATDLKTGLRGITDHWEVTKAFRLSTHTDCGQGYRDAGLPREFTQEVAHLLTKAPTARETRKEHPTIAEGYEGWLAKRAQKLLQASGYMVKFEPDRIFDAAMERAVRNFQEDEGLRRDGIIGPSTWKRLRQEAGER